MEEEDPRLVFTPEAAPIYKNINEKLAMDSRDLVEGSIEDDIKDFVETGNLWRGLELLKNGQDTIIRVDFDDSETSQGLLPSSNGRICISGFVLNAKSSDFTPESIQAFIKDREEFYRKKAFEGNKGASQT